jgi:NADPH:quinone reductase-like Zn-dependent oxidoreductase
MGLECVGYLVENGKVNMSKKYIALLLGGPYAEYVDVNKELLMEVPENIDILRAAAIPKVWLISYGL